MYKLQFKGNAIKLCRFGSDNAVKQVNHDKLPSDLRRGVWAFPFPFMEMFFAVHRIQTFQKDRCVWNYKDPHPKYDADEANKDYMEKLKLFKKTMTTFWWDRPFLSRIGAGHLPGCFESGHEEWWYWNSPKEWANHAKKTLPNRKYNRYSSDHLEIFCPIKGK